jgi:hypothetical protein
MNRDLASSATLAQSVSPQSVTTTVNGSEVDVTSYRWAYVVMNVGTNAATSDDASFVVEVASESGGSFAAVAGTTVTVLQTDDDVAFVGQIDTHQLAGNFIRVSCTGGTGGAMLASASVVLTADRDTQYAGTPTATAYSI